MTTTRVEIRQAGLAIEVPEGRTILEVALEQGIDYPHGCRSGRCGSCKSRLVAGEVDLLDHTRFALSTEEKAQGLILACRALPRTDAAVAWLGGDEEVANHPRRRLHCRVVSIEDATHDIKRIRLAVEDGAPLTFTAGQYARVTFPGAPTRDYSMANWPNEPELEFHIRRVPGGAVTTRTHALLKLGDPVTVEGPFGSSYLREKHAGPILCIAGGSGLAPIKSIVETALEHGIKQPIHVYFGVRTERDLYLVDHFEGLEARHTNLTFMPVLSETPQQAKWRTGFVTDAVGQDLQDLDGWKAYVAGPPAMVDAAMVVMTARGLRPHDLHADVFFTPEDAPAAQAAKA
ncbi:2Fe-2S iron-sulfur cluster-binding protein [Microvirga arabica]|uniref:2Fe-2S iron-sulfur cluster-binding protein n=1 Tax=Microvirga arabica TaxID=1128671 RepID=UPI00193A002D|nr:2Fe-2S iron-sulfur cluster-binding protein [Microvirga arabica]MBM1171556.1 2Fe-2S iron-sulfur cluster binding domain-containing protein [Microvirga arabica]